MQQRPLASCAGIAIYDPKTRIGGVAHVFFNEKTSYVNYLKDHSGREIPSTGKAVVVDNSY
jgi:chemotaxis receptor (MCP) glutamine deamidase CheD